jgi:hypothetical protein
MDKLRVGAGQSSSLSSGSRFRQVREHKEFGIARKTSSGRAGLAF